MYTLVDYITHIKGIEYILSVMAIGGFLLFWEVLKPKPFRTIIETCREDLDHVRQGGHKNILRCVGKILSAPFIGLFYIIMLPIGFFAMLSILTINFALKGAASIVGASATFEWRPLEAYLSGKKKKERADAEMSELCQKFNEFREDKL